MNNVASCTAYVWDHSAVWAWIYSNKSIFSSRHTLHRLPKIVTFWNEEGFLRTGEDGFCSHFWPGCFANRVLKSATLAAAQGDNICSLVLKEETITSHKHCFTSVCCRTWALDSRRMQFYGSQASVQSSQVSPRRCQRKRCQESLVPWCPSFYLCAPALALASLAKREMTMESPASWFSSILA